MNVTIVKVGGGNGSSGGNEFLGLDSTELKPIPSPLSETSVTLPSDNNDTVTSGKWFNLNLLYWQTVGSLAFYKIRSFLQ